MDFRFSEEQLDMQGGTESFLAGECTPEYLRGLVEEDEAPKLWPQISEMGLLGLMAPEGAGGLGMNAAGFALIAEEAGKVALPEPLVDVAGIIVPILAAVDSDIAREALQAVISGERMIAFTHPINPFLHAAIKPDQILYFSGDNLYLASADGLSMTMRESIDPLRRLFKIDAVHGDVELLATGAEGATLKALSAAHGAVFAAAELVGLSAGMIDLAKDYAVEREQFGAAIGSFQAVKHLLSTAFVKAEFARPVVYRAAAMLAHTNRDFFASHAKLAASASAMLAAESAIQVHGAMGYTFEVDLHLWMKRTWALAGLWGDQAFHEAHVVSALIDGDMAQGAGQSTF